MLPSTGLSLHGCAVTSPPSITSAVVPRKERRRRRSCAASSATSRGRSSPSFASRGGRRQKLLDRHRSIARLPTAGASAHSGRFRSTAAINTKKLPRADKRLFPSLSDYQSGADAAAGAEQSPPRPQWPRLRFDDRDHLDLDHRLGLREAA